MARAYASTPMEEHTMEGRNITNHQKRVIGVKSTQAIRLLIFVIIQAEIL
jgi:hypothetical protein